MRQATNVLSYPEIIGMSTDVLEIRNCRLILLRIDKSEWTSSTNPSRRVERPFSPIRSPSPLLTDRYALIKQFESSKTSTRRPKEQGDKTMINDDDDDEDGKVHS